jgi:hypothetical protein
LAWGTSDIFVIARSEATKQSILSLRGEMDCFASLAMTINYLTVPDLAACPRNDASAIIEA